MFMKKCLLPVEEDVIPLTDNSQDAAVSDPTHSLEADVELLHNEINYLSNLSLDTKELESEIGTGTEDVLSGSGRLAAVQPLKRQSLLSYFMSSKKRRRKPEPQVRWMACLTWRNC